MNDSLNSVHLRSIGPLPYYRSPNGVAILIRYMEGQGFAPEIILEGSGIRISDLINPDFAVTIEQELQIIQKVANMTPDPLAGLVLGKQFHIGAQGKIGAAAISSSTFLEAIEILFNHLVLTLSYFQYELKVKDRYAFMKINEIINLYNARIFVFERELVSIHRIASDLLGYPFQINEIRLSYCKPAYASAYEDIFKCPVYFNTKQNLIVFDSSLLSKQLPMSNSLQKKIYEKECSELSNKAKYNETVAAKVRRIIMMNKEGFPDMNQLAMSMNMSERTLRRRLIDEGTSYKNLSSDIKKIKAIDLLKSTSYSMEEISLILGYRDLPNFYRAFKSWTGLNPGYYRKSP